MYTNMIFYVQVEYRVTHKNVTKGNVVSIPLPNNQILDLFKSKAVEEETLNMVKLQFQPFIKRKTVRPLQIQSTCRQQNGCDSKTGFCLGEDRKHSGKIRKMLVNSIYSFSQNVFKSPLPNGRENWDCVVKS